MAKKQNREARRALAETADNVKFQFTIVILFWSALIVGAPYYLDSLPEGILPKEPRIPVCSELAHARGFQMLGIPESIKTSCRVSLPSERTIIFRMDDVQAHAWNNITINITETFISRNIPITLGVIPKGLDTDQLIVDYLFEKLKDPHVEIAQHGTNHMKDEFGHLNESMANALLTEGKDILENSIQIKPVTFIPPNNEYNLDSTYSVSKNGFLIVSASNREHKVIGNLFFLGYTIDLASLNKANINQRLIECEKNLDLTNLCVITMHPQDYASEDEKSIDAEKYSILMAFLDKLEKLDAKYYVFRDLIICG